MSSDVQHVPDENGLPLCGEPPSDARPTAPFCGDCCAINAGAQRLGCRAVRIEKPTEPTATFPACIPASDPLKCVSVVIPTCRRPAWCASLLRQLAVESDISGGARLHVHVHDDGSGPGFNYCEAQGIVRELGWRWYTWTTNHGKNLHWALIEKMWATARWDVGSEGILWLHDDFDLADSFIERLRDAWHSIPNLHAAALMPTFDRRLAELAEKQEAASETPWVESYGLLPRRTLDALGWHLLPTVATASDSGTHGQLSQRLRSIGATLWCTTSSLVYHRDGDSVMHPVERQVHPLRTINFSRVRRPRA